MSSEVVRQLRDRARVATEANRLDDAIAALREIVAIDPSDAVALNDIGLLFAQRSAFAEASEHFRIAIARAPTFVPPHLIFGFVALYAQRPDIAEMHFRDALKLAPSNLDIALQLGRVLSQQCKFEPELKLYDDFIAVQPASASDARLLTSIADMKSRVGDAEGAADYTERGYRADPNDEMRAENAIRALAVIGRYDQARAIADEAERTGSPISPASRLARAVMLLPVIAESVQQQRDARERLARDVDAIVKSNVPVIADLPLPTVLRNTPYYLPYQGLDDRPIQESVARAYLKTYPSLAWTAPHCSRPRSARERIRVGFVSTYLMDHTIGKLNAGLIERLDRSRFEVSVFHLGKQDEFHQRLAKAADRPSSANGSMSLPALREEIASHELDVLYFTDIGMHPMTYCLAFARLARVQCVAWGHPVTTGIPTIDYFVSSEHLESPGSESQYTEKLVRLPTLNSHYERPKHVRAGFSRSSVGLNDTDPLLVCPQSLYKFHPDFDEALGEILRRVPTATLLLLEGKHPTWGQLLRERFARSIRDVTNRIVFLPRMGIDEFLGLLDAADVNLDTPHFGGGNTSYEAFAFGSPIVTWPSNFVRGRITYAQYMQMGVTDLIARDMSHYVDLAVRLATDRTWRESMRATIRDASAKLYEDTSAVRSLEAFFERAVAAT